MPPPRQPAELDLDAAFEAAPDLDSAFEEAPDAPEPAVARTESGRRSRVLVMPEREVSTSRSTGESIETVRGAPRVEYGDAVDPGGKGPRGGGLSRQQRLAALAGALRGDAGARELLGRAAEQEMSATVLGQSDAGEAPQAPVVGRDRRGMGAATGAAQGLTSGYADELRGFVRSGGGVSEPVRARAREALSSPMLQPLTSVPIAGPLLGAAATWAGTRSDEDVGAYERERDRARDETRAAREQEPGAYLGGEIVGGAAQGAAIPGTGATTALGRIGGAALSGAAQGAVSGLGHSEAEDAEGMLADAGTGAAAGGLMGGGLAAGGEALGAAGRYVADQPGWQRLADRARLEASGFWGERARRALGGSEGEARMAADLRSRGVGGSFPRADRAAADLERIGASSGEELGRLAQSADEAGVRVDLRGVASEARAAMEELRRLPVGGRQAAEAMDELVRPLSEAGEVSFGDAWRQRQVLDDLIGSRAWQQSPGMVTAAGRLQRVRRALARALDESLGETRMGGSQWGDEAAAGPMDALRQRFAQSRRGYEMGRISEEVGGGGSRLSVGGGVGGGVEAGDAAGRAAQGAMRGQTGEVLGAIAEGGLARGIAQATRMRFPGVVTRAAEAMARIAPAASAALEAVGARGGQLPRWASTLMGAAQRGTQAATAAHFVLSQTDPEYRAALAQESTDERAARE